MCNAAICTVNQSAAALALAANGAPVSVPLGTVQAECNQCGCDKALSLVGNGIALGRRGLYEIEANVTVTATAAGVLTFWLLKDGVPVTGAQSANTVSAGGTVTVPVGRVVSNKCCEPGSVVTVAVSSTTANTVTVNNVTVDAVKL
jgi:hypothetical protein